MASLFKTMSLERITVDEAEELLQLPRTLGVDPADGEEIIANNGRYGPYVQKGKDFRNIDQRGAAAHDHARRGAARSSRQPKVFRAAAAPTWRPRARCASSAPTRSASEPVVAKDGKFGVYVTDGETNASLSKGDRLEAMPPERAYELLAIRREAIIEKGGAPAKKARATKKAASEEGCSKGPASGRRQEEGLRGHTMRAAEHKFRGPNRAVAVPIVWTVLGIVLAIATESPTYGVLMTVFFGAFLILIVRSWPTVEGTTVRVGSSRVDFAANGTATISAVKPPMVGRQLIVIVSSPNVRRLAVHVTTKSNLIYRPADYAALSAAMRSRPSLAAVADQLDHLVGATKQDRDAYFEQRRRAPT